MMANQVVVVVLEKLQADLPITLTLNIWACFDVGMYHPQYVDLLRFWYVSPSISGPASMYVCITLNMWTCFDVGMYHPQYLGLLRCWYESSSIDGPASM
ncbi:hypothetical protein DPMN_105644 [Dreissena polymorpha]|uniref:Uncharacterized protein n=1 Tax=Dreissena polymorpha TaxID=45954 RepID=A0A9D4K3K9_DREPO|nr:hypothetical protein DPMN_105644 [Dreissena polymorpha]